MFVIRSVDPSCAIDLLCEFPPLEGMTPPQCQAFCRRRGLIAFAAEQAGDLAGFTVAESDPRAVHFLTLEGDAEACRVLLDRLIRAAGERDVSGWCPADRDDLRALLERLGFRRQYRDDFQGCPADLYHCRRND